MKESLKSALREHIESDQLPPERLRDLLALAQSARPEVSRRRRARWLAAAAAAFTAALLLGLSVGWFAGNHGGPDLVARIADEVALNHLQLKPLESESEQLSTVDRYLDRIGIRLSEPASIRQAGWRLIGGRYCSIQGVTAAQLRYYAADDGVRTVYQAAYRPDRHGALPDRDRGEPPRRMLARGVQVTLWVQGGVLFATASDNHAD